MKTKPKLLSKQDAEFIQGLLAEGVRLPYIAAYVYGITPNALRWRMRSYYEYLPKRLPAERDRVWSVRAVRGRTPVLEFLA